MTVTAALVWCPFPDQETASTVAERLLEERLVACANIFGEVGSVFEWKGEASRSIEVPVLFKTGGDILDRLIVRLGQLHPYEVPAILGWRCDAAHPATLLWLKGATKGDIE